MKITQAGAIVAAAASLLTLIHGYSFTDTNPAKTTNTPSKSTTNEENRIYGGTEGDIGDYPFLAGLRDPFLDWTICSATLIAPQYLITAAHCVKKVHGLVATFGTNVSTGDGHYSHALRVPVIKQYRHPLYQKKEHLYDVGMLKLEWPVKRKLAKLCAYDGTDSEAGTIATVAGWGKTEFSNFSYVLQELQVPIISNAECGKFEKYVNRITEGMLCAGTGHGRDTCSGDSGGPLLVNKNILVGCVSWGSECGEQAGVFTRLTYVMDYIEDILAGGDGSKFGPPEQEQLPPPASHKTPAQEELPPPASHQTPAQEELPSPPKSDETSDPEQLSSPTSDETLAQKQLSPPTSDETPAQEQLPPPASHKTSAQVLSNEADDKDSGSHDLDELWSLFDSGVNDQNAPLLLKLLNSKSEQLDVGGPANVEDDKTTMTSKSHIIRKNPGFDESSGTLTMDGNAKTIFKSVETFPDEPHSTSATPTTRVDSASPSTRGDSADESAQLSDVVQQSELSTKHELV